MSQPKVVTLSPSKRAKADVPPILHSVRQRAKGKLNELLQDLFNNIDDALFEMADRSSSDSNQTLYFGSMRDFRLHRKSIAQAYLKEFYRGFDLCFSEAPPEEEELELEEAVDNISMLQDDDLEISVAITGMVSKVTSQHSLAIMQLTKRFDHLNKKHTVTERMNPLGPECLSQAFVHAANCVDLDIQVRIILLKLYERFVMERLAPIYDEANLMLAEAGVLPDLKKMMRRDRDRTTPRKGEHRDRDEELAFDGTGKRSTQDDDSGYPSGASAGGGGNTGGSSGGYAMAPGSMELIQELLLASRGGASAPSLGSGPSISTTDLVDVLSAAQNDLQAPIDLEQVPTLLDLRQLIVSRAAEVTGTAAGGMHQADDDVVNFVGLLFDYILNDRNLAIPMKALIGRLQLPVVKLAVMDKTFFEQSSHPARQLLNELSSAGIGWSGAQELKRDALYNEIESIVLRIMNGFSDEEVIFTELLDELRAFVHQNEKKNAQVEQRVKETETGRARRFSAKDSVQKLINQKASGMRMPPEVSLFISDTWAKVLVYAIVTKGTESPVWQRHVQTLDDLLWSLQPLDKAEDIEHRNDMRKKLLTNIAGGMYQIQISDQEGESLIATLQKHLEAVSTYDSEFLDDDNLPRIDEDFEEMEEVALTTPQEAPVTDDSVTATPESIAKIKLLSEGIWVELVDEEGEKIRCKLATIIEPGQRYIFVNRRGMKVAEKSQLGLAANLDDGALTILAESQVFDRALQAVIGNLRQMHSTAVAT